MAHCTYRMISIAILMLCLTGFGSALRVVTQPQPFSFSTEKLNVSCIADEPAYSTKSILNIQILRHIEDKPIAIINLRQHLKTAVGIKSNIKAEGHIDINSHNSYLTLMIDKPDKEDAGTYRCQMFYTNEDFRMVEKNVIGNATYQEQDITSIVGHLTRKLSALLAKLNKRNDTMHSYSKQHITFKELHSKLKTEMDVLSDKVDAENKELDELKDNQSRQKQDIDILNDKLDSQNNTDTKLTKQVNDQNILIDNQAKEIDELKKDNANKQQQLDTLMGYIKKQKEKSQKHESQLVLLAEWTYYEADKTFIKVFGKDGSSSALSWSKARDACRTAHDGGDLVQIRDTAKNNFVYNMARTGSRTSNAWIGIINRASSGYYFKYVDGNTLRSYHPWLSGQPDGGGHWDEKCVMMYTGSNTARQWKDYYCSVPHAYVCSVASKV